MADKIHPKQRVNFPLKQEEYTRDYCGQFKGHRRKLRAIFNSPRKKIVVQIGKDLASQMRDAVPTVKIDKDRHTHVYALPGNGSSETAQFREAVEMCRKRLPASIRVKSEEEQKALLQYYIPTI